MAQTQETSFGTDAWIPMLKDVWGTQLKTAQIFFDTSTKLSQSLADFYQTQAAESLKVTQQVFQTAKTLGEETRRQYTTLAEKVVRPQA